MAVVVAAPIDCSMTAECTSRFSNCCSNLSITAEIFCSSIELTAFSRDLTTEPMFLATPFMACADCTREATAST